jgi:hypothetical protein
MHPKYNHHIFPILPFLFTFPLVPNPTQDLLDFPVLHFFKCILIVQGGFHFGISHMYMYCSLIRLTTYITYSLSSFFILLFNSFQSISLYYLHAQMQCISVLFTLYHSLYLSCLPIVLSDRLIHEIMFSLAVCLSLYVYVYVYKVIYIFMYTFIL